jgi:hypothetical protein
LKALNDYYCVKAQCRRDFLSNLRQCGIYWQNTPHHCCLYYPDHAAIKALVSHTITQLKQAQAPLAAVHYIYDERMLSSRTKLMQATITDTVPELNLSLQALANSEDGWLSGRSIAA